MQDIRGGNRLIAVEMYGRKRMNPTDAIEYLYHPANVNTVILERKKKTILIHHIMDP